MNVSLMKDELDSYNRKLDALFLVFTTLSNFINPAPKIKIEDGKVWVGEEFSIQPNIDNFYWTYIVCLGEELHTSLVTGVADTAIEVMSFYMARQNLDVLNEALDGAGFGEFIED